MRFKTKAVKTRKGIIPTYNKKCNPKLEGFSNRQLIVELENRMVLPRYALKETM